MVVLGPRMLGLMVVPVALAMGVALVAPRASLRSILALRLRGLWLIWAAAFVQALRVTEPQWAAWLLRPLSGSYPIVLTWVLGIAFCVVNVASIPPRARWGLAALAVGFTMNAATMVVNHGMPFSVRGARLAGLSEHAISNTVAGQHAATSDTSLMFLADIVPVPGLQKVVSVGDIFMILGITWLLAALMVGNHAIRDTPTTPEPASAR